MKMRKCFSCKIYTFKENCPECNKKTASPEPPRFSPEDKYGKYRRKFLIRKLGGKN
jgi:H/ACA ribonucleoprotein complex subunit 3